MTATQNESWRAVSGFRNSYEVSDLGRVRSLTRMVETVRGPRKVRGRVLRSRINDSGYALVTLCGPSGDQTSYVHRIVAEAFHGSSEGREVCHGPGPRNDNRASNLRWGTHGENIGDSLRDTMDWHGRTRVLSDAELVVIFGAASRGGTYRSIADQFHIDFGTVGRILRRERSWKQRPILRVLETLSGRAGNPWLA